MRKPRSDGQRNRERLITAARAAFLEFGPEVSLDDIARRSGVGIGTLYRHFSTREALVEAVYQHELEQLSEGAARLMDRMSPGAALHAWMHLCIDYVATKKVIVAALGPTGGTSRATDAATGVRILETITTLVERARAQSEVREDVDPRDLLRALVGFTYAAGPKWEASARRLVDVLMDGLRQTESSQSKNSG